jgi:hypothetical protein
MVVNCTPHTITFLLKSGRSFDLPPSGTNPRVLVDRQIIGYTDIDGEPMPIKQTRLTETVNLPDAKPGVYYVVSLAVAMAKVDRVDLLVASQVTRNDAGDKIGCRSLSRVS